MRIICLAVICAFPAIASAVDFRGVDLGDTCRHAAQVESSLGSRPLQDIESMLEYNVVVFEDESIAGQRSRFFYSCMQTPGVISRYSIDVRTRSETRAWEVYAAAKAAAVARLGKPSEDSSAPEATTGLRRLRDAGSVDAYAFATWNPVSNQSVIVTIDRGQDEGEWNVATIVSAVQPESPDKSAERTRER